MAIGKSIRVGALLLGGLAAVSCGRRADVVRINVNDKSRWDDVSNTYARDHIGIDSADPRLLGSFTNCFKAANNNVERPELAIIGEDGEKIFPPETDCILQALFNFYRSQSAPEPEAGPAIIPEPVKCPGLLPDVPGPLNLTPQSFILSANKIRLTGENQYLDFSIPLPSGIKITDPSVQLDGIGKMPAISDLAVNNGNLVGRLNVRGVRAGAQTFRYFITGAAQSGARLEGGNAEDLIRGAYFEITGTFEAPVTITPPPPPGHVIGSEDEA